MTYNVINVFNNDFYHNKTNSFQSFCPRRNYSRLFYNQSTRVPIANFTVVHESQIPNRLFLSYVLVAVL